MISENLKKRIYTSFFLILLLFLMLFLKPILLYFLIIIGIFSIIEFSELIKAFNKEFIPKLFYNLIFILFIFIFCLLFFIFSNIIQFKIILFSLLFTCIASDVGGYIFGKTFKGPKITKISPNKTFSGSIGSIILSCVTFSFCKIISSCFGFLYCNLNQELCKNFQEISTFFCVSVSVNHTTTMTDTKIECEVFAAALMYRFINLNFFPLR